MHRITHYSTLLSLYTSVQHWTHHTKYNVSFSKNVTLNIVQKGGQPIYFPLVLPITFNCLILTNVFALLICHWFPSNIVHTDSNTIKKRTDLYNQLVCQQIACIYSCEYNYELYVVTLEYNVFLYMKENRTAANAPIDLKCTCICFTRETNSNDPGITINVTSTKAQPIYSVHLFDIFAVSFTERPFLSE